MHIQQLIESLMPDLRQVRVDSAKEFLTNAAKELCYKFGIELKKTEPYEHAQASKVEKQHGIIHSMVRAWLREVSLPKTLWYKASAAAVFVKHRSTNSFLKLQSTPYEMRYGTKPPVDMFKVIGCLCFAHIAKGKKNKLDDNAIRGMFVGYSNNSPGYELYDLNEIGAGRFVGA